MSLMNHGGVDQGFRSFSRGYSCREATPSEHDILYYRQAHLRRLDVQFPIRRSLQSCDQVGSRPSVGYCRRHFLFERINGLFDQLVRIMEMAALNLRVYALYQLGVMDFKVQVSTLFFKVIVSPQLPFSGAASLRPEIE
jgi:hypothetical protein